MTQSMNGIVSNCPLCEEHSLHFMPTDDKVMQCLNCGYVSSQKYLGIKKDNEEFSKLSEEMKEWAIEDHSFGLPRIWIPSMITLPFAMLYPTNVDGKMKWALSKMVDIPKEEQKNYPVEDGEGFYKQRYDTENEMVYDEFLEAMVEVNESAKSASKPNQIKLPKLKSIKTKK